MIAYIILLWVTSIPKKAMDLILIGDIFNPASPLLGMILNNLTVVWYTVYCNHRKEADRKITRNILFLNGMSEYKVVLKKVGNVK